MGKRIKNNVHLEQARHVLPRKVDGELVEDDLREVPVEEEAPEIDGNLLYPKLSFQ